MVPDFEPGSHYRGPLYRLPVVGAAAGGIPTPMLGVARRALDEVTELARTKTPVASSGLLKERASAQLQLGRAEAILRSGRLLLLDTLSQAWRRCIDGETHSLEQKADLLLAMAHAMSSAVQAVDLACSIAGTTAFPSHQPVGTLLPGCPDDETSCLRLRATLWDLRASAPRGSTGLPRGCLLTSSSRDAVAEVHDTVAELAIVQQLEVGAKAAGQGGLAAADEDGTDGWTARAKAGVGCPRLAEALSAVPVSGRAGGFADERRGELQHGIWRSGYCSRTGLWLCPGAGRPRGPGSSLRLPRRSRRRRYGPRVLRPVDGYLDRTGAHQQRAVPVEGRTVETLESARPPIGASHQLALVRAAPPPGPAAEGGQRRPAASPVPTAGRRAGRPSTPLLPGRPTTAGLVPGWWQPRLSARRPPPEPRGCPIAAPATKAWVPSMPSTIHRRCPAPAAPTSSPRKASSGRRWETRAKSVSSTSRSAAVTGLPSALVWYGTDPAAKYLLLTRSAESANSWARSRSEVMGQAGHHRSAAPAGCYPPVRQSRRRSR